MPPHTSEAKAPQPIHEVRESALNSLPLMIVYLADESSGVRGRPSSEMGHFRPRQLTPPRGRLPLRPES
jgi:hypothetical protein